LVVLVSTILVLNLRLGSSLTRSSVFVMNCLVSLDCARVRSHKGTGLRIRLIWGRETLVPESSGSRLRAHVSVPWTPEVAKPEAGEHSRKVSLQIHVLVCSSVPMIRIRRYQG
jgi:hypothetical protein